MSSHREHERKGTRALAEGGRGRRALCGRRASYCLLLAACCLLFSTGCRQDMQDQPRYEAYEATKFFKDGLSSRPLVEGTVPRGYLREDAQLYTGKKSVAGTSSGGGATGGGSGAQNQAGRGASGSSAGAGGSASAGTQPGTSATGSAGAPSAGGNAGAGGAMFPDDVDTFPFPVTAEVLTRGQERYQIFCSMCHGDTGAGDGLVVRRGYKQPPSYYTEDLRNAPVGHFYDVITNGWGSMPRYSQQIPVQDRWAIVAYIRALQLSRPGTEPDKRALVQPLAEGGGQR
ncbi:MAG TPA: cytochrome c [Pyrinomonadaceae bacterium]|nr:cytochrome c [Pyrinomonadaceae bacterium]